MAIDVTSETLLTFVEAARRQPHPVHVSTLHRWRLAGVKGVRLETCMYGGRRMTSLEAIKRFVSAVSAVTDGQRPPTRTPRQRQRAIEQAERELGILVPEE